MLVTLARYRGVLPALEQEFAICFEGRLSTELAACGAPVHVLGEVGPHKGVNYLIEAMNADSPLAIIGQPFLMHSAFN